jgi:nucleoside transporter
MIRWRLSAMMFLQYMVWGSWFSVLSAYLERIGFNGYQIGVVYSLLPLGCMIAPLAAGQVADRYVSTEKLLGALHLIGGVLLCAMARIANYDHLVVMMLAWSIVYAPTLALSNSITFQHLPDAAKKFGLVRVFGTLGWIAAGILLTLFRRAFSDSQGLLGGGADSLWLGGLISIALGLYCFSLPGTPPAKTSESPWAFLTAFKLLRDPGFAIFIIIAFVVSTELMFYYVLTAPFLESIGIASQDVPAVMTVAQAAEIGTMLALPLLLGRWGLRWTMALGMLAWPLRYAVFAYGGPRWLVVAALTLHGLCYVCFFVAAFIYVDTVAPSDVRASAQGFITFVTLGAGLYCGSRFAGWVRDHYTSLEGSTQVINYTKIFLVPCVLTTVCAVVFFLAFREKPRVLQAAEGD